MSDKVRQAHITVFPKDKENYIFTQQELDKYYTGLVSDKIRAYIVQGEYTKDKKQHLQIYMQFTGQMRYPGIKKHLQDDTIHIEPITYGKIEDCINYCTDNYKDKDGNPKDIFKSHKQFGEFKIQGQRSDIEDVVNRIRDGERLDKMLIQEPNVARLYCQYSKGLREVETIINQDKIKQQLASEYDNVTWKEWQQKLIDDIIMQEPDGRKVNWFWETEGNVGKSYLADYLVVKHDAYHITGGKKADILYAYQGQKNIIFDLSRDIQDKEYIYDVIETLLGRNYTNSKYQSRTMIKSKANIIVFANFEPEYHRLSQDRWNVTDLNVQKMPRNNSILKSVKNPKTREELQKDKDNSVRFNRDPYKYPEETSSEESDDQPQTYIKYHDRLKYHNQLRKDLEHERVRRMKVLERYNPYN